ncbi:hypothetical protein PI124_g18961 [Phytophthora idaei]|nr:hypothetical protein PI126_g19405 [Phytophthora idaei]KAG3236016.1 hypothetical protein PI124_g18961 [Phytophthora idaei]
MTTRRQAASRSGNETAYKNYGSVQGTETAAKYDTSVQGRQRTGRACSENEHRAE